MLTDSLKLVQQPDSSAGPDSKMSEAAIAVSKPITDGQVPLALDCFSAGPMSRRTDQALHVEVERGGQQVRMRFGVPEILVQASPEQRDAALEAVKKSSSDFKVLTLDSLSSLPLGELTEDALRIATDQDAIVRKPVTYGRGTSTVIDDDIPDSYDDATVVSCMGHASVSKVGEVLCKNILGHSDEEEKLLDNASLLANGIFELVQAALKDQTNPSGNDDGELSEVVRGAEKLLGEIVDLSTTIFHQNDPRPDAREVQKQEMYKIIKHEVARGVERIVRASSDGNEQAQATKVAFKDQQCEYFQYGSDAGTQCRTEVDHTATRPLLAAAATACPSIVSSSAASSVASSECSDGGEFDDLLADTVSVSSSESTSSAGSARVRLYKCLVCNKKTPEGDLAALCCESSALCKRCAADRGKPIEPCKKLRKCAPCRTRDEKRKTLKSKRSLGSIKEDVPSEAGYPPKRVLNDDDCSDRCGVERIISVETLWQGEGLWRRTDETTCSIFVCNLSRTSRNTVSNRGVWTLFLPTPRGHTLPPDRSWLSVLR